MFFVRKAYAYLYQRTYIKNAPNLNLQNKRIAHFIIIRHVGLLPCFLSFKKREQKDFHAHCEANWIHFVYKMQFDYKPVDFDRRVSTTRVNWTSKLKYVFLITENKTYSDNKDLRFVAHSVRLNRCEITNIQTTKLITWILACVISKFVFYSFKTLQSYTKQTAKKWTSIAYWVGWTLKNQIKKIIFYRKFSF